MDYRIRRASTITTNECASKDCMNEEVTVKVTMTKVKSDSNMTFTFKRTAEFMIRVKVEPNNQKQIDY